VVLDTLLKIIRCFGYVAADIAEQKPSKERYGGKLLASYYASRVSTFIDAMIQMCGDKIAKYLTVYR